MLVTAQERQRRQAVDRERRWRNGVTPRSLSLMQRKPWEPRHLTSHLVSAAWHRYAAAQQ